MNYQKIKSMGYDIHIINNNKFHTTECRIYFTENVNKELITYRNALISILTYATNKYDTKAKLIEKCQDLYSLVPVSSSIRNGNLLTTRFSLSTINSSYISSNNYSNEIELVDYLEYQPKDDEYYFMVGFNETIIPNYYMDTEYLTDNIKKILNLETTKELNKDLKNNIINNIKNIKNLTITYKLKDNKSNYYPSSLVTNFNIETDELI